MCAPRRARSGTTWWSGHRSMGWAGWSACPAFPGRPGPRRCRTSAPTASRWPTPSPGSGCWTGAAARCAGPLPANSVSATAPACSSTPMPAVVLEVEFALDASGRSAPLRYGELAAAWDVAAGERADPGRGPRGGAGPAGAQGHGARRGRPRHLERRVVLHQSRGRPRGLRAIGRSGRWSGAALPGTRRRQAGRRLAGRTGGVRQGLSGRSRRPVPVVHQARAGVDQPRRRRPRRT